MAKKAPKKFDLEVVLKIRTTIKVTAEDLAEAESMDISSAINGLPQKFQIIKTYVPIAQDEV